MTRLALASLRHRPTGFVATFLAVLLGAMLIGTFAPMIELAVGADRADDRDALLTMGAVVGGWGIVIVLFAVASTVGITIAERDAETGLLRTIGATKSQVRRMVRAETCVVATIAAICGAAMAIPASRALFMVLRESGMVSDAVGYRTGWLALAATAAALVLTCLGAGAIAGHRATRGAPSIVAREDLRAAGRLPRWRWLVAVALIGYGVGMGLVTILVTQNSANPYEAMATSGSDAILVGLGMAVLAPVFLRMAATPLRPLIRSTSAAGFLAAYNTSRRAHLLAGVLGPVIVLTAAAASTIMLVGTDHRTLPGGESSDSEVINTLNNVVVGMISLFAAIMVINAFATVIAHRRRELQRLRLIGATRRQAQGSVLAEAIVVAVVGITAGLVASLATTIPFCIARGEGVVPDGQLWVPPVIAVAVTALTLASAYAAVVGATRRAVLR